MNNSKGEMTQNDERPLSNREAREVLGLAICLEHGPIEEGDHAEVQRRHRLLRTVPSQMKHHFKGYRPKALEYKANLVRNMAEWLNNENWLTEARNSRFHRGVYLFIAKAITDQWHREEALSKVGTLPDDFVKGDYEDPALGYPLWENAQYAVWDTINLVTRPSFAAKHWKTEEVAA